jgi:chromosome segregation protein
VFLKSLTLKGFKSFAEATTVEFEPGVTVVVGPNGSGKSNLVDAVAWVMGAQGPRTMRSGRMDDVIFAGTAARPALGRAEVTLTIDNSSGRLPVGLAEVTVKRTLFRSGESEYAINGAPCRLLDVQELLSDAGVGRQQHVIVGQGQLDEVLESRPEERRLLLEEAAGVLKFRRRRERAERRLESVASDLERVSDLLREVRRQQRPLERQAEATRRHGELSYELRALRLHSAGRELSRLAAREKALTDELAACREREQELLSSLAELDEETERRETEFRERRAADLASLLARFEAQNARAAGQKALVAERRRWAEAALAGISDDGSGAALEAEQQTLVAALAEAGSARREVEDGLVTLAAEERELAEARASLPDEQSSEGAGGEHAAASELRARLAALRHGVERDEEDLARRSGQLRQLELRLEELGARATAERASLERLQASGQTLEAGALEARRAAAEAEHRAQSAKDRHHRHQEEHQSFASRAEALALALDEARSRGGHSRVAGRPGVLGSLVDLIEVDPGWDAAVAAALGDARVAVVVEGMIEALAAAGDLQAAKLPGTVLATSAPDRSGEGSSAGGLLPPGLAAGGLEPVRAHVRGAGASVERLLDVLLERVVVAGDWRAAAQASVADPTRVVVTLEGERFSCFGWRFRGEAQPVTAARFAEAERRAAEVKAAAEAALEEAGRAEAALVQARQEVEGAEQALRRHQAELADRAAKLDRLEAELASQSRHAEEARRQLQELSARRAADREEMARTERSLSFAEGDERRRLERQEEERASRERLEGRASALRDRRAELEVVAGRSKERHELLAARLAEVEARRQELSERRLADLERRQQLELTVAASARLGRLAERCIECLGAVGGELRRLEEAERARLAVAGQALDQLRGRRTATEQSLSEARERARRLELDRAEVRLRLEANVESLGRELGASPEEARQALAPELPAGVTAAQRERELDRELRLLGPVNPLAVTELDALSERAGFLEGQLEDVRASRRELGRVIRAIDAQIVEVFEKAFADTARHFEKLCATLLPGGMGRLRLTDPDDLLRTGVDVEARPAGKQVRRLSLLSGGERSLVALAFLFAVFRSRPSPFYIMDEVEAALDDVNLVSFLELVQEFKSEAQLILVTHQKRTMEAADCLYGVTMRPGQPSQVVSERVGASV